MNENEKIIIGEGNPNYQYSERDEFDSFEQLKDRIDIIKNKNFFVDSVEVFEEVEGLGISRDDNNWLQEFEKIKQEEIDSQFKDFMEAVENQERKNYWTEENEDGNPENMFWIIEEKSWSDELVEELEDRSWDNISWNRASTGTVYIDHDYLGDVRIADHEPNGKSHSIEIDLTTIDDYNSFLYDLNDAETIDEIEQYVMKKNTKIREASAADVAGLPGSVFGKKIKTGMPFEMGNGTKIKSFKDFLKMNYNKTKKENL